jgi:hypothetical protein
MSIEAETATLFFNYGVLGLWTITLLFERKNFNKDMKQVIERNTIALTKVHEVIERCPIKKR